MNALLVAQLRQIFLGIRENLSLISTAELRIHLEVLFVQHLQTGIQKSGQQRMFDLLDNLSASLLCIVLRYDRRQFVHVQRVLLAQLIVCAANEPENQSAE